MVQNQIRILAALAAGLVLAGLAMVAVSRVQAAQPPPDLRYRWLTEIETLAPREYPDHLSQPAVTSVGFPQLAGALGISSIFQYPVTCYLTGAEVVTNVAQLQASFPGLVTVAQAGQSWLGQPIMAVRLAGTPAAALPPDQRLALYLDGLHHAREPIGSQVVLYSLWYLASLYGHDPLVTHLLDTRTLYAIPAVNPDGNDVFLASNQYQRKNTNPTASDDDGDGRFDEDGPEGFGYDTYNVYHFEFIPDWISAHAADPFAAGWNSYVLSNHQVGIFDAQDNLIPQIDNDADGRVSEDPPGGVDLNRNYDSHWDLGSTVPRSDTYRGTAPFSERESQVVRDFVLAHPHIMAAASYHSGSDILLFPWGWSAVAELPDDYWYARMSTKGSQLTEVNGFRGSPHGWTAQALYAASGSAMDWMYGRGIMAWSPEAYAASSISYARRVTTTNTYTVGISAADAFNPTPLQIAATADRWNRWNLYLLAATPHPALSAAAADSRTITLTVANDGLLPVNVELVMAAGLTVYTRTVEGLSAAMRDFPLPWSPGRITQTVMVTLSAQSAVKIGQGSTQTQVLQLQVGPAGVVVAAGSLAPFVDLGPAFGGWFAGDAWDTPDGYHLGPPLLIYKSYLPWGGR
ncbi:MAG: hypothetical protein EXR62_11900 [Chloroflexi bacterium]|nr:hypothetical protein [Chloroflexota bacterium]